MQKSINRNLILDPDQVEKKIKRMAFQIVEDNCNEKFLVLAGIWDRGYFLAQRLAAELKNAGFRIQLIKININKRNPGGTGKAAKQPGSGISGKAVILVDDVLNSGKTLLYACREFLPHPVKKIKTAVLVNREHCLFPVKVDFSGLNLSTTLQEQVRVEIKNGRWFVYLV